jgi:predicted nucleotidyltransferase
MYAHHAQTIARVSEHFLGDPELSALLLVGSIAHGFAEPSSDVDIAIILSDSEHARRSAAGELTFFNRDLAKYEGGYVDGKYSSLAFLDRVERRGSEPARYAFAHAQVLWSRVPGLAEQLQRIARYPAVEKAARVSSFHAQLEAWHWYAGQAAAKKNDYLMLTAVSKLILFAGRLVLAHNELLYPYHKWFFRVLEQAPDKPVGLVEKMTDLSRHPSLEGASELFELINGFHAWDTGDVRWPQRFLLDTELTWMHGVTPIDDA